MCSQTGFWMLVTLADICTLHSSFLWNTLHTLANNFTLEFFQNFGEIPSSHKDIPAHKFHIILWFYTFKVNSLPLLFLFNNCLWGKTLKNKIWECENYGFQNWLTQHKTLQAEHMSTLCFIILEISNGDKECLKTLERKKQSFLQMGTCPVTKLYKFKTFVYRQYVV